MNAGTPKAYDGEVCKMPLNTDSGFGVTAGEAGAKVASVIPAAA